MTSRAVILVVGGTGRLGRHLIARLGSKDETVRVFTRIPNFTAACGDGRDVEVVVGDVRDPGAIERAVSGARVVISAMSAFGATGGSLRHVDGEGNERLIGACERHGVEQFILVSVRGASAAHPMELHRMKYRAEQRLLRSTLAWSVLRPSSFTETFQQLICAPLVHHGQAMIFGEGRNPINFVSVCDVARFLERAMSDDSMRGQALEIGGPENLTLTRFVEVFAAEAGVAARAKHIPRILMRLLSVAARPFNPAFARKAHAGLVMDTTDMRFDSTSLQARFPTIHLTSAGEVARRDYGPSAPQRA
ncbi:MAG: SDR family oxidoreductase [Gemmatimonadota bacterium]